jgi:glutamate mutase epsilon subunit
VVAVRLEQLSFQDLEELREQITEYYETYYAELRGRLSDHSVGLAASVPDHLKGYRRIVTELGEDGAVISHWRAGQDHFDFHISP